MATVSVDPAAIASAVRACRSVAGLSGGFAGEAATYLPGRRVVGVRMGGMRITVHVVGRYGPTVAEIADEVTAAVHRVAGPVTVDVVVEDLAVPGEEPTTSRRPSPGPPPRP